MKTAEQKPRRKRQLNPDRIVLDGASVEVVKTVALQIEESFGGIIKLTHKEIANFMLQNHAGRLSASELLAIKDKYFDDVQAAQWALQKLKAAKVAGNALTLVEVLGQLQTPIVKEKRKPKKPLAKPEKATNDPSHERTKSFNAEPSLEPQGASN